MSAILLYHNPGCSKSRAALDLLRERGADFAVREYLRQPLDRGELGDLLQRLGGEPADLVRRDKNFEALGLDANEYQTAEAVVALLVEHPELMQRPVVARGDRAVIARPPEQLLGLL